MCICVYLCVFASWTHEPQIHIKYRGGHGDVIFRQNGYNLEFCVFDVYLRTEQIQSVFECICCIFNFQIHIVFAVVRYVSNTRKYMCI